MVIELILQAADVALPSWAWAALVGVVMLVLGSFITKFTKHSEVTISGPVEIRVLQENAKRIETQMRENDERVETTMSKGFGDLKKMFESAEARTHAWKNQLLEKIGDMTIEIERLGWRIDSVEKELTEIREKKIGMIEIELRDLHNHKSRIAFLENELKDLKSAKYGGTKSSV